MLLSLFMCTAFVFPWLSACMIAYIMCESVPNLRCMAVLMLKGTLYTLMAGISRLAVIITSFCVMFGVIVTLRGFMLASAAPDTLNRTIPAMIIFVRIGVIEKIMTPVLIP